MLTKDKSKREQMTIRLPADLKLKIQQKADELGVSFNAMLIILVRQGLLE